MRFNKSVDNSIFKKRAFRSKSCIWYRYSLTIQVQISKYPGAYLVGLEWQRTAEVVILVRLAKKVVTVGVTAVLQSYHDGRRGVSTVFCVYIVPEERGV